VETIISHLVARFEKGSLNGCRCSRGPRFQRCEHRPREHSCCKRSVDFYQKMFGFSVVSQDQAGGIIRLGNTKVLESLMGGLRASWTTSRSRSPRFNGESATRYLTASCDVVNLLRILDNI
jgi:hypothetical protein